VAALNTNVDIAYDRVGHGPTLVLLHPLGADRFIWAPIVERLQDRRELITVDLPGFGESPPLEDTPTPRALAAAVAELLETIGVRGPHVTGISLGGWVALELGLTGVPQSTTAIAPAGLWPEPLLPKPLLAHSLAQRFLAVVGPLAATPPGRRMMLSRAVAHPGRVPGRDAAHLVRTYALAPGFATVNTAMRAGRFEALERIRGPLTLVWPEHDKLVRRPAWLPDNVHNMVLKDAGHIPVWDAPDALAEILLTASENATASHARAPAALASETTT
jgi:pimeloyl-ACP methyl ester carboxylesterase